MFGYTKKTKYTNVSMFTLFFFPPSLLVMENLQNHFFFKLLIFYFPFSPDKKIKVDYVPSNFVKSWTWQHLSLTNSFVIHRYPCWAMCLWPSKAGGAGELIHQISIGSQKWSLTLKPSRCITATYNNSSSEKDGHYYTHVVGKRSSNHAPFWYYFSSFKCANKILKNLA
jgi:hypothetical protein